VAEAIGAAIITSATAAEVGAAIGVSAAAVTTAVGAGATLLGGVALNVISSALQGDPNKVAAQQFQSRQPLPSRTLSYGTVKVGGAYVQYKAQGYFIYAIYHGEGPINLYKERWLDDIQLKTIPAGASSGVVGDVPWRGFVDIESLRGFVPQAASGLLLGTYGWDGAHNLNGCAYSVVRSRLPAEKQFKKYYPKQSWSNLRVVMQARQVRSPYDGVSYAWTDRAGACIFDLLTDQQWGFKIPVSRMNLPKWAAFNDLCSQVVTKKNGVQVPRYFLGGTHNCVDDLADTLNAMLQACDGELTLEEDGTIGVRGGKPPVPDFTITDDMVTSLSIVGGNEMLVSYNRLKINFVDPNNDYQQVEGQPWDNLSSQQELDEILEQDLPLAWVQDFNQARRLAKITMEKGNPQYKVTMVCDLRAAGATFSEAVYYDSATYKLLFKGLIFKVKRFSVSVAEDRITLDLESLDPACYSFDAATEEGTAPALPNNGSIINNASGEPPAPPAGLTVATESRAITANEAGNYNAVFLRLTATPPANRPDLKLIGRYRVSGSADWTTMVADTDNQFSLTSSVLQNQASYQVEGAVSTYGEVLVSDYLAAAGSPISVDNAAPNFPTTPPPTGGDTGGGETPPAGTT
jgi:hypothetical protein